MEALWPSGQDRGLAPLLSKLRRVVPLDGLRPAVDELWVDIEAAAAAVHRAESSLALGDPHAAWGPSQVAMFVAGRPFLAGEEAPWIDVERRRLGELHMRALEAYAASTLGVGGTELSAAVRAGRKLVALEPYRESGHRILMEALDREGNTAEALLVYEALRAKLRDELGINPSSPTQDFIAGCWVDPRQRLARRLLLGVLLRSALAGAHHLVVDDRRRGERPVVRRPFDLQRRVRDRRPVRASCSCSSVLWSTCVVSAYSIRGSKASTIAGSIASKPCSR